MPVASQLHSSRLSSANKSDAASLLSQTNQVISSSYKYDTSPALYSIPLLILPGINNRIQLPIIPPNPITPPTPSFASTPPQTTPSGRRPESLRVRHGLVRQVLELALAAAFVHIPLPGAEVTLPRARLARHRGAVLRRGAVVVFRRSVLDIETAGPGLRGREGGGA